MIKHSKSKGKLLVWSTDECDALGKQNVLELKVH